MNPNHGGSRDIANLGRSYLGQHLKKFLVLADDPLRQLRELLVRNRLRCPKLLGHGLSFSP